MTIKYNTTVNTLIITTFFFILSCAQHPKEKTDEAGIITVSNADKMMDALGGKESWLDLKSINIKAMHNERAVNEPYYSEKWRRPSIAVYIKSVIFLFIIEQT